MAITVATQNMYNVNSKTVRDLASKFVPIEGKDIISKGLHIQHYSPNKNDDIKNEGQKVSKVILKHVFFMKHMSIRNTRLKLGKIMKHIRNIGRLRFK